MLTRSDRAAAMEALACWFDSQDIPIEDRAYICAQLAGLYFAHFADGTSLNQPAKFAEGLDILAMSMKQAALTSRKDDA